MRRANVLIVILLAALVLAACDKDGPARADKAAPPSPATGTATIPPRSARDGCRAVAPPVPSKETDRRRSRRRLHAKRSYVAVLRTNCGMIRIRLAVRRAPRTTSSFAGLARNHFYDGLTFHRIAKPGGNDFVIQGGDPLGNGNGGPGYSVVEAPPKKSRYLRGVVAMAKAPAEARGTSGSQFFIVTARDARLPADYAVLGRVVGDTSAVRRIARLAIDPETEMPIDPVVIASIRIRRR